MYLRIMKFFAACRSVQGLSDGDFRKRGAEKCGHVMMAFGLLICISLLGSGLERTSASNPKETLIDFLYGRALQFAYALPIR